MTIHDVAMSMRLGGQMVPDDIDDMKPEDLIPDALIGFLDAAMEGAIRLVGEDKAAQCWDALHSKVREILDE